MSSDDFSSDRRAFCQAGALLLAGSALPACGAANNNAPCNPDGGGETSYKPADVKMNSAQPFIVSSANITVFICQDANGFYAMDANCTHRGCFVNFLTNTVSFSCPCHGATFDFNGGSPTAPAPTPMPHYSLCVDSNGKFVVDVNKTVDASTRLKP